jgi:hypothetical protein
MALKFRCAECGTNVRLPDERRGRKNYCPRCDARLPEPTSGGAGLVIALVIGGIVLAVLAVVGIGVAAWLVLAVPAGAGNQVAPAPAMVAEPNDARAEPMKPDVNVPAGPRKDDPNLDPGLEPPPKFPDLPDALIPKGPDFPPPVEPKGPPPVKELKLPAMPTPVDIKPAPLAEAKDLTLPEAADRAAVGGSGRFLILHLPKTRKLAVFDANTVKIERYIDLAEDKIHFTAGMNKLLVFLPTAAIVRRYDLLSGQMEISKPFKVHGVNAFVMGHASAGPLIVRGDGGARLYDITTFAEIPLPTDAAMDPFGGRGAPGAAAPQSLPFDGGEIWASGNGHVFGNTGNFGMPNGVQVVSLEGGKVTSRREHTSTWFVQPSADGKYIFAGGHKPLTIELKPAGDLIEGGFNNGGGHMASMFLPAHHGPYYMELGGGGDDPFGRPGRVAAKSNEIRVYLYGLNQPVATITLPVKAPAGAAADWARLQGLPTAFNLIPRANLLVVRAGDKLQLIPIDLEKELEKSGAEFLVVTSAPPAHYKGGAEFRYQVRARSKAGDIQFKLDSGPEGMKVAADGAVTWRPPIALTEQVSVLLNLKDKAGKEAFHSFILTPAPTGEVAKLPNPVADPADPPVPPKPEPAKNAIRIPPTPARLPITAIGTGERRTYVLPEAAGRVLPAGGGRFFVIHLPKIRKVGVFDVNESKIVRFIDMPEDKPLLAAGMSKLAVYLPSANVLRRYDLLTGAQEASKVVNVTGIRSIGLGSASAGPLAIATEGGGKLFDLDTLTEMELPKDEAARDPLGRPADGRMRLPLTGPSMWVSANGRVFISGGGVTLEGDEVKVRPGLGDGWMFAQTSADGKYVFRGGAGASTIDGQKTGDVVYSNPGQGGSAGYFFLPAADGPFYFHVNFAGGVRGYEPRFQKDPERAVTVYMYGLDTPLARILDLRDIPDWGNVQGDTLPMNERVQFVPRAKLLVTINAARDKFTLVPLDMNQALDEAGIDFLLVTSSPPGTYCSGKEFRYPIRVRSKASGTKFSLESGPAGMKVSPDGVVTWSVPATFAEPEVNVIVNAKDAAGKEAFHSFRLIKSDRVEEYVPDPEAEPVKPPVKVQPKSVGPRAEFKLPVAPPPPAVDGLLIDARTEVKTPDKFDTVVSGGEGRFLILHARTAKKVFLFDASTGSMARTIDLGDDKAVVAAGMTQLVVYRPSTNEVEKFNLLTGASEGKKVIPTKNVTEMVMGSASAGPLFVRSGELAELYDVETLLPMDLPDAEGFPFAAGRVWASADGRTWANTVNRAAGPLVRLAMLSNNAIRVKSELVQTGYAVPGSSGKNIYLAGFGELDIEFKPGRLGRPIQQSAEPAYQCLPVPGTVYALLLHLDIDPPPGLALRNLTRKGVTIWRRDQSLAVATLTDVPEMVADLQGNAALPSLVHFVPDANLLITVPASKDRLALYPVRLEGAALPQKKPIAWRLPEVPPAVTFKPTNLKERTAVDLPGRILKVSTGGGGRYLVLQTELRKLAIFDVVESKVVREIATDLPINSFAAGMTKIVLLERSPNGMAIRRFDLLNGKQEAMAGVPADRATLAMGSGSAGPVLVMGSGKPAFYDLATLAPLQPLGDTLDAHELEADRIAVSDDGQTFAGVTRQGTTVHQPVVMTLANDGVKLIAKETGSSAGIAVAPDGKHIFLSGLGIYTNTLKSTNDVIFSPETQPVGVAAALTFVPAVEGPYYLHIHTGSRARDERFAADPQYGLTIYKYGQEKPVGRLPNVLGATRPSFEWTRTIKATGGYHFYPSAKLLVALDPSLTKVHLIPVDPDNMPVSVVPEPVTPKPKNTSKRPTKADPPALPPAVASKPFRLAPLPEPLPVVALNEPKTFTFTQPLQLSPMRVKPAGGGLLLVVQRSTRNVDVFDLNEAKVVRQIDLPERPAWAAGMSKLFVWDRSLPGLRRFDLLTGKMDAERAFPRMITPLAVGSATNGPLLCREGAALRLIDGDTLAPMVVTGLDAPELANIANMQVWPSADGRSFAIGQGGFSGPAGGGRTITLRLNGNDVERSVGTFPSMFAMPDASGRYLFAGGHGVYDIALKKTPDAVRSEDPLPREPPNHLYLPASSGPFYVQYHLPFAIPSPGAPPMGPPPIPRVGGEAEFTVYAYGQKTPIAQLKCPDPLGGDLISPFSLGHLSERVFLVPESKALIVVAPCGDKIHLVPLDLEAAMSKSGVEVPWVKSTPPRSFKPGVELKYPLQVASKAGGLKYKLESPAAGMVIAPDGVFSWKPPADAAMEVRVTIRITNAKGRDSVNSFLLTRE